jgi:hypothetical protein
MVSTRFTAGRRARTVPAVILAAALATAAAACGSSSSSGSSPAASATSGTATGSPSASPVSTAKVTGAAATALITKAIANTKAAPTLLVIGSGVSSGSGSSSASPSPSASASGSQQVSFNLTLVQKAGCQGTIALSKVESFQLVETGGFVWLKPTDAFYATLHLSQAALALVADKYIKVPTNNAQLADLTKICSFSGLFGTLPTPTGTSYVATPTTYNGRSAYQITQTGQTGYAFITNSSAPVLMKLGEPTASGGVITFTEFSKPVAITAPSDAESIDGTKLGI